MILRIGQYVFSNAYILLCLTTLFWAGNFVLARGVSGHIPPISLSWFRWLLAFFLILPFTIHEVQKDWNVIKANLPNLIFLGVLSVGTFNTLAYIGLNYTTAINALVLQSSSPVLIVILGFFIFRDTITSLQGVGILASLAGVLIVIFKGDLSAFQSLVFSRGDAWILVAMFTWAIYTVFFRTRPDIHWKSFTVVTFGIGVLFITPLFIGEIAMGAKLTFDFETLLALGYVSIFPSTLAYLFYNRGIELLGSNRGGVFMHLVPLFGTLLAVGVLGEKLQLFHISGFVLILLGIWIASRK